MAEDGGQGGNADQIAYWNANAGQTWAALQDRLDRLIEPLGAAAMAALAPAAGERVLDIGCGCGQTTLALADRVGPTGAVTGADISHPMLAVAQQRASGHANVRFVEDDVQTHLFAPGALDAAFSRFGVMFFGDPVRAFANIRKALRPGGRLAFVCWRPFDQNPWMNTPMIAAQPLLGEQPAPPDPFAPGPFAFADADRTRGILGDAGWVDVDITPHDEKIGSPTLDAALEVALRVGPLGAQIREKPELAEAVLDVIRASLSPHMTPEGLRLGTATWIVQARAPQ